MAAATWDLSALLNAADPKAALPERHLWLIRLLEWLRHAPVEGRADSATPLAILRLRHLLGVLDRHPEHHARVGELLRRFWVEVDSAALLADFGFAPRMDLWGEVARRLQERLLPRTPDTNDLGELFALLFPTSADAAWLLALDDATLARVSAFLVPTLPPDHARRTLLDAVMFLVAAVRSAGFSPVLRLRMDPELLAEMPFRRLARVADRVAEQTEATDDPNAGAHPALLQEVQYLRGLLDACRRCADSVHEHLEAHGVSVDVMFELDQLRERTHRIDALLNCVVSPAPAREVVHLLASLVAGIDEQRSLGALFSRHYSLLARKVAERSAETGEHYITRDRREYARMLRAALGGGTVIAGTTFIKFAVLALGLSAFWGGFWAGINYAASFVLVQLLHWTVATKQPAMTAPAMAEKLTLLRDARDDRDKGAAAVEEFVDEVVNLIRSQAAGIFGNLAAVAPIVLLVQLLWQATFGEALVGPKEAQYVLKSLSSPWLTVLFASFTGVLLFFSSLIAGWVENWFVWHRLDSAIAWNPKVVARLGAGRAQRWATYWRGHISGFASNTSLGLMLGLVPVVLHFFGLPLEVRHVTLSTGQLSAAVGALGFGVMRESAFWWCVAGIAATGVLNLTVSFLLAFRVALRSRGIRLADRSRIYRAIRQRLWRRPASFIVPPRDEGALQS